MNKKNLTEESYYHLVTSGVFGVEVQSFKTKKELKDRVNEIVKQNLLEENKPIPELTTINLIVRGKEVKI